MDLPVTEIKLALQDDNAELAVSKTMELLKDAMKIPITIAITGESGSGKSTLVNALRGVDQRDEEAAPTGVAETTMQPTKYTHPDFPNVTVWDLPGVGTTRKPAESYVKEMGFKKFDFFFIVSATRFRENDAKLALEIQKMEKNFYFVRSKVDNDVNSSKRSQKVFNEAETLQKIRNNCCEELQQLGVTSPKVFLISGFDLYMYDFPELVETLSTEMPQHKRHALLLTVPTINQKIIEKKREALRGQIQHLNLVSSLVIVPVLSTLVDDAILNKFTSDCHLSLGFTQEKLERLSEVSQVSVSELTAVMNLPLCHLGPEGILTIMIPFFKFIPGWDISSRLNQILDCYAENAQNVFKKALGQ